MFARPTSGKTTTDNFTHGDNGDDGKDGGDRCDVDGCGYRPRNFLIELDTYMTEELYIKTLLH